MSNVQTYRQLINRFEQWANAHDSIRQFTYGSIDVMDIEKMPHYPFMHVIVNSVSYAEGVKNVSLNVIFCDKTEDKGVEKSLYQSEVLSDLQQIAEDLISSVTFSAANFFGELVSTSSATAEPFIEQYENWLIGWNVAFELSIPFNPSSCEIPASISL